MTEYWSGSITFTGLGSSTDFDSIIEATMEVESYRLNQMENWATQWESKLSIIQELNTQLSSYQTTLESMDSVSEFLVKSATSSDTSLLSVSADSDAQVGAHNIVVNQLAQNDIHTTTASYSSTDDVVTTSNATFSVEYNGELLSIDIPAGTTLENMVTRINKDADMGSNIRASLVNDGSGYYMQIRGLDQGADYTLTFTGTMAGFTASDFNQTQTAQNAQIKVDGFPPGASDWIERDSNTISDVIEGLTINLYDSAPGETVTVTIGTDYDAVIANVEKFIEETNAIRTLMNSLDDYDSEDSSSDVGESETTTFTSVHGNYGVDIVEQTLQNALATRGVGFSAYDSSTGYGDLYATLASIGITTDADQNSETFGLLVIDYDELQDALETDPDGVASLFAADDQARCDSPDMRFESLITSMTEPGTYDVEYTVSGGKITGATINGNTAKIDGSTIIGDSGNPEVGLAVEATNLTDGTYSGTVYVQQGKINELIDILNDIADPQTGTLAIIEDSYQTIIDNNADAILKEEARLDSREQRLIEQYARLEATLGEYDNIASSLESQIDSLDS